jgi:para-nitrobenzyl esterase
MIGTVKNEFMASLQTGLSNANEEQVMEYVNNRFGANADAYIEAVKKAYPNDTRPSDLIDVDVLFRPGAVDMANIKSAVEGGAPVYMYLFTWQSPVFDGKYKALHCMELPFVFNNIARCESMTGGGPDAYALAEKVSAAWVNFARTGNPNHASLPDWPAYTTENTATMHFDNTCTVKPQMDKEIFEIANSR